MLISKWNKSHQSLQCNAYWPKIMCILLPYFIIVFNFVGFSDYILTSITNKRHFYWEYPKKNLVVHGWKNERCIKFHEAGINNQSMKWWLTSWWALWALWTLWTLRVAIFWISSGIFHNMFFTRRQVCPPHFSCCFVCIWLKIRYSLVSNNKNSYIGKSLFKNIFSS